MAKFEMPWVRLYPHEFYDRFHGKQEREICNEVYAMLATIKKTMDEGFDDAILREDENNLFATSLRKTLKINRKRSETNRANAMARQTKRVQAQSEGSVSVPVNACAYGSEQNVYLTPDQYNELVAIASQYRLRLDDVNNVIEALSCKLKDGTRQSADHFATLKGWINYRGEHPNNGAQQQQQPQNTKRDDQAEMARFLMQQQHSKFYKENS